MNLSRFSFKQESAKQKTESDPGYVLLIKSA
jgi:hypothetical protein